MLVQIAWIEWSTDGAPAAAGNERVSGLATSFRSGWGGRVTAVVDGPAWSARGLVQHDSRYPLKVEGAVQRAVTLLLPGVSTASEFVRYFALYAALAAHAEDHGLGGEACRELVRRSVVVLAGVSMLDEYRSRGRPGEPRGWRGAAVVR